MKFLNDECWYGGIVYKGHWMPIDCNSDISMDLANGGITQDGTQAADQYSPLFFSNKGRYIASKHPFAIHFDKGDIKIQSEYEVEISEGHKNLKGAQLAAAKKYFSLSGEIPQEEFLSIPQYNTWIELMYNQNQKQILEYAHSIVDNGMSAGILMIDEGWAPDYGDFDFSKRRFENPKQMVDELHDMGFKVMLWITPHISPDSHCFRSIKDKNFLLMNSDGSFAIREWWNGYSCILDLSNPEACAWFKEQLDGVIEKYGVDGFKFDAGGAHLYRASDRTYIQQSPCEHTKSFDMFSAQYKYNELRAVWNCGGMPIVCRLQDKNCSWDNEGITWLMPHMLMQGLLGYFYGCPDMIGGGAFGSFLENGYEFDEELYLRWLAVSVLCPMMQFSISPKRVLSEKGFETARNIEKLHEKYADTIIELAHNASVTGEPIMRMMEYEFPNQGFERVSDQFMLGSDILVAPVIKKGELTRDVMLPQGKWQTEDGKIYEGGKTVSVDAPLDVLPLFKKI